MKKSLIAIISGLIGVTIGGVFANYKGKKNRKESNNNRYNEGVKSGKNKIKQKFSSILKTQKERDQLMILSIKIGVYVGKIDGAISNQELFELNKICLFINQNPTTPKFIKEKINKIIQSEITYSELNTEIDKFLETKTGSYKSQTITFLNVLITTIINADRYVSPLESEFLKNWKSKYYN